jgi:hypothetical protein
MQPEMKRKLEQGPGMPNSGKLENFKSIKKATYATDLKWAIINEDDLK